ncbi:MAG TPA: bifunctional 2-polyprenyl-6-hydroxyphenol methylase/3-demethylubiquinol 3-O-methyltransferase UbiG [Hellea balneolensis]|uniref:Ubiquinone biosynthesis O-methyltransferase n=1 Tax=Hellea balneolensis TaxID=287478 RepID=A0A7C5QRC3_9PROT|nr:bifunctional 2-polyprenyl-6-hydroxyphenol methylase/3-demethylubiquinol 3-O-methyltransferase UbiG [Hellea balneolensis]
MQSVSVSPDEMKQFAEMAEDWWNPTGKFKPLHIMNGCRTRYIKEEICAHFGRDENADQPLEGLSILDVGCGGGLLSEPLARLGANVTGVDALEVTVKTAKTHAKQMGLDIDYIYGTAEGLVEARQDPFDVVMAMEIIEHVNDPSKFLYDCAVLTKPGGLNFCSTINRTARAFWLAIFGAEYVLRWLPKGTHQYEKFIKPDELVIMLKEAGLEPDTPVGMMFNPLKQSWKVGLDTSVNFMVRATKPSVK